jgi:LmbE family N-acetylglucosaminyl deacetylase
MRLLIILSLLLAALLHLDIRRTKAVLRRVLIGLCRGILNWSSKPYQVQESTTVVFAPHQDDETLGCGALIARKRQEGRPVHVVFITDGSASHLGHPRFTPDELKTLRRQEAREALRRLGVESCAIHFLDEPDGTLGHLSAERRSALIEKLTAVLHVVRPNKVFLPYQRDGSSEHDAAFELICTALNRAAVPCDVWQYPVWAWWNPHALLRLAFLGRDCCKQANEDFGAAKSRALNCYASQVRPLAPWPDATLPAELVRVFHEDAEYFFRHPITPAAIATNPTTPK